MPQITADVWKKILLDYERRHCCNEEEEIAWFRSQPSLRAAIECAARAMNRRDKRYRHQSRIRRDSIAQAFAALIAIEARLAQAESFDALLKMISDQLKPVPGIGELYCYDTAFRIGAKLELFPERVYLHSGTRTGAAKLGLPSHKSALELNELPGPLRRRAPHEIEDILCIYKDHFGRDAFADAGCAPGGCEKC
jgi:hypothetical protein